MKGAWAFEVRGPNELREVLGSVAMIFYVKYVYYTY